MKANEAPEKLYVDVRDNLSDSILYGFTEKRTDEDIEYVRNDRVLSLIETLRELRDDMVKTATESYKQGIQDGWNTCLKAHSIQAKEITVEELSRFPINMEE